MTQVCKLSLFLIQLVGSYPSVAHPVPADSLYLKFVFWVHRLSWRISDRCYIHYHLNPSISRSSTIIKCPLTRFHLISWWKHGIGQCLKFIGPKLILIVPQICVNTFLEVRIETLLFHGFEAIFLLLICWVNFPVQQWTLTKMRLEA